MTAVMSQLEAIHRIRTLAVRALIGIVLELVQGDPKIALKMIPNTV